MGGMRGEGEAPTRDELEAVVAASRVGWVVMEPARGALRATALADLLEIPDGPVTVETLGQQIAPTHASRVIDAMHAAALGKAVAPMIVDGPLRGGRRRPLAVAFGRIAWEPPIAVAVVRDTDRDPEPEPEPKGRAAEELRFTRAAHEGLEKLVQGGSWIFDMPTMRLMWSDGVFRIHGLDPASYTPSVERGLDLIHPDDRQLVVQMSTHATIEGSAGPFDSRIVRNGDHEGVISTRVQLERDADGSPVRMFGAVVDVTEQRRREKMLADAQRTDALGRMAGGIAHDFNNLLTAMTLGLAVVRRLAGRHPSCVMGLDTIEGALSRASALTRRLLAFSRRLPLSPRALRPDVVLAEMEVLLRRLAGDRVSLTIVRGDDEVWPVKIDQTQLEQVILNLVVNARDAIVDAGAIRVEIRNVPATPTSGAPHVGIDVVDDGVGMSPELLAHVFEPFFTTKRHGEGSGLGLATCVAIVEQARGRIVATSAPGAGSRLSVLLPRSLEPLAVEERTTAPPPTRPLTVLVIDDDDAVRGGIVHELEWQGHAAMAAASAPEALQLATGYPGRLDLCIVDVALGRDDGVSLAHGLEARLPGARILLITGFVPTAEATSLPFPVLIKPFTGEALARAIAEVLAVEKPT
jgi:two-component system cell cycle sensor histidine kinase/response regulator CckA